MREGEEDVNMKKFLQVLFHILGFPALIALVVLINLPIIKGGISYGIFVFVGVILVAVMAIVYYITFICMVKSKKKSIAKQTLTLVLVVFFCLCGFWCVVDVALPNFLADATSSTIYYEDLVDNFEARAIVNQNLLNEYIKRNYNNGNLPDTNRGGKTLAEYQSEGMKNPNVEKLLAIHFASIDKDGYASFVEPWIGMANDSRLTIPTLIHLLTDERELEHVDYALYDKETNELLTDPVLWNVLDMMGTSMDIAMSIDIGAATPLLPSIVDLISGSVATVVEEVLGSPIYISYDGTNITLTPSNEGRGVLDYQSMAWLNSNGLIYAIVSLMSIRNIFLIFAGWIILLNFMIGMLRGMGKEERQSKAKANNAPRNTNQFVRRAGGYPYSYVEVRPSDYNNLDMGQIRQTLIRDTRDGLARRYNSYE